MSPEAEDTPGPDEETAAPHETAVAPAPFALPSSVSPAQMSSWAATGMFPPLMLASTEAGAPPLVLISAPMFAYPPAGSDAASAAAFAASFPYPPPGGALAMAAVESKPKRQQVKRACSNCAAACKRCDDQRPCSRCLKHGVGDNCQDTERKERQRGIKRGPYKRRNKHPEGIIPAVLPEGTEWPQGPIMLPFPPAVEGFPPLVFSSTGVLSSTADASANGSTTTATSGAPQPPALFHLPFSGGYPLHPGYPPPFLPSVVPPQLPAPDVKAEDGTPKKKRTKKRKTEPDASSLQPVPMEGGTPHLEEIHDAPL